MGGNESKNYYGSSDQSSVERPPTAVGISTSTTISTSIDTTNRPPTIPVQSSKPPGMSDVDFVIRKLKKSNKQALDMSEDELREWSTSLCIHEELKQWYLDKEFASTVATLEKLDEVNANAVNASASASSSQNQGLIFSSTSESAAEIKPNTTADEGEELFIGNLDDYDHFELEELRKESEKPFMKIGKKIKIKLIIAEICKSDTKKALRKMLSPVLTKLDVQQQFGMFHSALIVGPWYLEWNTSSLCIPRKCYSSAAMIAADLEYKGVSTFDLDETVECISKVIIDWNVNREYDQNKANCQQFVDDLCKALGIPIRFEGLLGNYLKKLRRKGVCEIFLPVNDDMKEQYGIKESKVYFHDHGELDRFVNGLLEKNPMFAEDNNLDWNLLKSFDRAFWLRHFDDRNQNDRTYEPHTGCSDGCPFGDPSVTASFKKTWF